MPAEKRPVASCAAAGLWLLSILFLLWPAGLPGHHGSSTGASSGRVRVIENSLSFHMESAPGGWLDLRTDQAHAQIEQAILPYLSLYGRSGMRYRSWPGRPEEIRQDRDRLGSRLVLPLQPQWLLLGHLSLGLASGADRKKRVDQNFYDGTAETGIAYRKERWLAALVVGGSFPLSALRPGYYVEQWMIAELGALHPHEWLPGFQETVVQETFLLKKTTQWEGSLFYQTNPWLGLGFSALYRRPYGGLLVNRSAAGRLPSIFREISLIATLTRGPLRVEMSYAYPLFRGSNISDDDRLLYYITGNRPPNPTEYRLYSHAWRVTLYMRY
ncbi:MAG: hypothetical protein HS115_01870 [Spirochaetales bacterium]|nr:hypothetical protein [Spirochaetales bacterium]